MALYRYIKTPLTARKRRSVKLPLFIITVGLSVILWTVWPIISFSLFTGPRLASVISPVVNANDIAITTNANTWYPTAPQKKVSAQITSYTLSIPKLGIKDATAIIASDDLSKSLIHYGGTALPGQYGNAVIIGHSTLPQFFNPKDYKTIFATLPTLKIGDEIFIKYDGVEYRYVVINMRVTDPDDLSPLAQQFDDSYITLITCVPPGTTWKRLNVKARLVRPGQ